LPIEKAARLLADYIASVPELCGVLKPKDAERLKAHSPEIVEALRAEKTKIMADLVP
jgi:hypothetical protein